MQAVTMKMAGLALMAALATVTATLSTFAPIGLAA